MVAVEGFKEDLMYPIKLVGTDLRKEKFYNNLTKMIFPKFRVTACRQSLSAYIFKLKEPKAYSFLTTNADKIRSTANLAISAANDLLAPFMIFKGKLQRKLNISDRINKIEYTFQEKSWMTKDIFLR